MNASCRWLHEERHLAEPLKLKKLRVEHRVLSLLHDAQLRHLLSFKPKTSWQHRTHLAVCVVLDTGLRVSEVLGFRSASKPDWQGRRRKACALVALDAALLLSDSLRSSGCPNAKPRGDWVSLVLRSSDCTKRDGTGLH